MSKSTALSILILFICLTTHFNNTSKLETKCTLNVSTCIFSGVRVTQSNPTFYPVSVNNSNVQKIQFKNSTVQILTNELCNAFPNLRELRLTNLSLEHIEKNVFHQCKKLINLNIWMNNFSRLNEDVFNENQKLIELNMQNNGLEVIRGKMFDSVSQLTFLNLAENALSEFPIHEFPVMGNLTHLFLYSNNLTDLDERQLKHKFPNLEYININNNLFTCDRLKTIIDALKFSKIKLLTWYEQIYSNRDLNMSTVGDILCLTKEQGNETQINNTDFMNFMVVITLLVSTVTCILVCVFSNKVYDKFSSGIRKLRQRNLCFFYTKIVDENQTTDVPMTSLKI